MTGLLQHALFFRVAFSKQELLALSQEVGLEITANTTAENIRAALIQHAFKDKLELITHVIAPPEGRDNEAFQLTMEEQELADMLEDMAVHDSDNFADLKDKHTNLKMKAMRCLHKIRAAYIREKKKQAAAKSKRKGKDGKNKMIKSMKKLAGKCKRKGSGTPTAKTNPEELPAPSAKQELALPKAAPSLTPPDVVESHAEDAATPLPSAPQAPLARQVPTKAPQAREPPADEAATMEPVIHTPQTLKDLAPSAPGSGLSLDTLALQFRGRAAGTTMPSVSFGPHSGRTRRQALDEILDAMWTAAGLVRPDWTDLNKLDDATLNDILDEPVPPPKRYKRS